MYCLHMFCVYVSSISYMLFREKNEIKIDLHTCIILKLKKDYMESDVEYHAKRKIKCVRLFAHVYATQVCSKLLSIC